METLWQDVKFGARMLAKRPGFTAVAIMTLALGIGANTAIFSVVNAVLLRPLPFSGPDRLVIAVKAYQQAQQASIASLPDYNEWREQTSLFADVAALQSRSFFYDPGAGPESLLGGRVTWNFFRTLGVTPELGREFLPEEDRYGAPGVVIISHSFWVNRLGQRPDVLGTSLRLGDETRQIVGVLPATFRDPLKASRAVDIWVPLSIGPNDMNQRGSHWLIVIARLRPGASLRGAQAEVERISKEAYRGSSEATYRAGFTLVPLLDFLVGDLRSTLWMLLGAVGLVMLIACVNVANLQFARALGRRGELAVRAALGAGRRRLVVQLLVESVLLALAGGILGVVLALWCTDLIRSIGPAELPRFEQVTVDLHVLSFAFLLSMLTGILCGTLPAWRASGTGVTSALKAGASARAAHSRLWGVLVVSEVALAIVLLTGAGLLLRSFVKLLGVNPGFSTEQILTMDVAPLADWDQPRMAAFYQEVLDRVGKLPAVKAAGFVNFLPLSGDWANSDFSAEEFAEGVRPELVSRQIRVENRVASSGYFSALGIPLRRGRLFSADDARPATPGVILSEDLARLLWGEANPIGRRVSAGGGPQRWASVVGVVAGVRHYGLKTAPSLMVYTPLGLNPPAYANLVVRAEGDLTQLVPSARAQILGIEHSVLIDRVRTMDEWLSASVAQPKFYTFLLGSFAALGVALAAMGLYGVLAYRVTQRTHEIGIRMALGARPVDVLVAVVRQGMTLVVIGIVVGMLSALAATRALTSLLFGVAPTDPLTFVGVTLLLLLVSLLACWIPARRATRVDPMIALHYE